MAISGYQREEPLEAGLIVLLMLAVPPLATCVVVALCRWVPRALARRRHAKRIETHRQLTLPFDAAPRPNARAEA
jgi:hypothetical protein